MDRMEKTTRNKTTQMLKVIWESNGREEITWETAARMKAEFPEWMKQFEEEVLGADSRTNPYQVGETCSIPDPR